MLRSFTNVELRQSRYFLILDMQCYFKSNFSVVIRTTKLSSRNSKFFDCQEKRVKNTKDTSSVLQNLKNSVRDELLILGDFYALTIPSIRYLEMLCFARFAPYQLSSFLQAKNRGSTSPRRPSTGYCSDQSLRARAST